MTSTKMPLSDGKLPDEILFDIFSRLPIREFFRCQLVCKDWYKNWTNLVTDPLFINLHHSRINQDQDGSNFLIQCCTSNNCSKLYLVDHENHNTTLNSSSTTAFAVKFKLPMEKIKLVGSSNGLLCLCLLPDEDVYYICNPITREVLKLPIACGVDMYRKNDFPCPASPSGFVFDESTNTYKVIHTWFFYDKGFNPKTGVEIYTIGSGRWRRVNDVPTKFSYQSDTMQVFVNGALHWHTCPYEYSEFYNCIGAIDIKSENFKVFTKPPDDGTIRTRTLGVIKESLCLIDATMAGAIVLWIMKDDGITNSRWTKECIVQDESLGPMWRGLFENLRTVKQQSVLFHKDKDLGYYDVEKNEFKHVRIDGIKWCFKEFEAVVHLGSLISPRTIDGRSAQKSTKTPKLLRPKPKIKKTSRFLS